MSKVLVDSNLNGEIKIDIIDTDSGYTPEEEAARERQIPIPPMFRDFIRLKKKSVERQFKMFKENPITAAKKIKEYHKKMVIDVFINVDVPVWFNEQNIFDQLHRKVLLRFAVGVLSFKERKFSRWLL